MNPQVDAFVSRAKKWQAEIKTFREIILAHKGLEEEFKWGKPCYTFQGSNLLIIQPFKEYCALMFCKGALLKDPKKILVKPGENTQAARQVRVTSVDGIVKLETFLQSCIQEAIAAEKAGLKVEFKKEPEPVPEELQAKFKEYPKLKTAFNALTPGRQRAYILHISAAKQSKTREARIEKCMPQILSGKGLND